MENCSGVMDGERKKHANGQRNIIHRESYFASGIEGVETTELSFENISTCTVGGVKN